MMSAKFDLEDFLSQVRQIKKIGPLNEVMAMSPDLASSARSLTPEMTDKQ